MDKLIADIKAFCLANYSEGYDSVIECWDTEDYTDFIARNQIKNLADFIAEYAVIIDYKNEIRSTAF